MKVKLFFLLCFLCVNITLLSQTTYEWYDLSFDLFGEYTVTTHKPEEFSGIMEGISFSIIPSIKQEMNLNKISGSIQNIATNQGILAGEMQNIEYASFQGIWLEGFLDSDLVIMVGITDKESYMSLYIILVLENEFYKSIAEKFVYSIKKSI